MTEVADRFACIRSELGLNLADTYDFTAELAAIYDHIIQIMGNDSDAIRSWMHTPKKSLNNRSPESLIQNKEGLQVILKLLRKELEMDSRIG